METLQDSVETLKGEKEELQNELNILKRERGERIISGENNQMKILEKVDYAVVDPEKPDESANLDSDSTNYLMETENDAVAHTVQADMKIELEALRTPKREQKAGDNPTDNSPLIESANASKGNIQVDLESLKAEQVDPLQDEGDKENLLEGLVTKEAAREFVERKEARNASENNQSKLLETLKAENASLVQAVQTLNSEKADMHRFHSQVGRKRVNDLIMMPYKRFKLPVTLILMKVLETLRNEFEEELAAKDARILQVTTFLSTCEM